MHVDEHGSICMEKHWTWRQESWYIQFLFVEAKVDAGTVLSKRIRVAVWCKGLRFIWWFPGEANNRKY